MKVPWTGFEGHSYDDINNHNTHYAHAQSSNKCNFCLS